MKRANAVPRVLIPALGMIALALIVGWLPAQERQERQQRQDRPETAVAGRVAPSVAVRSFGQGSYLGVYIREVTGEDVERLDLSEERGALVTDVPDEGPAAEAGLDADDVIVSWNGSRLESAAQLRRVVAETPSGRSVEIGYVRDGRQRTVSLELDDGRGALARFSRVTPMPPGARARIDDSMSKLRQRFHAPGDNGKVFTQMFFRGGRLGAGVQGLTDQLAEYFGASDGGALVNSVQEDSPAAAAGLRAGDVIVGVGDADVEDTGDLLTEISRAEAGEIELRILRDGRQQTLRATLPEREEREFGTGSAYYFGPEGLTTEGDFDLGVVWQDGLMDQVLPMLEFDLPALPDVDLYLDAIPSPPREPVIQT